MDEALRNKISGMIEENRVLLFMKGTRHFPQCGFSATVTQILDGLIPEYETVNVLADGDIRQGIKEYSSWPTIPQLYVGGQFVGGCDIVREMFLAGELHSVLGVEDKLKAPTIELTESAQAAIREAIGDEPGAGLRVGIGAGFEYELAVDGPATGDFELDIAGITVRVDRGSAPRADGMRIDFSADGPGGFRIDNPNEPPRVKDMSVQELDRLRRDGVDHLVVDVRPEGERRLAALEGAVPLDDGGEDKLVEAGKGAMIVFLCHHGNRSRVAAERYLQQGYERVYNLAGGIEAWSRVVDDSVPRY